jgi:hypothetical protein
MSDLPTDRNLLADETSPYLLQHAANPVHWRPWGPQIFAEAAARDSPILLSVGYAACHWCHVMAHESFENPAIANLMNRLFVNVKVDREERPDVDQTYMAALHAMGEQGGWPLTMFLDPQGRPFWGGTYFPPEPRFGRPSFPDVLRAISQAWTHRRTSVTHNAEALIAHLRELGAPPATKLDIPTDGVANLARALLTLSDPVNGGIAGQPKFPNAPLLETLLRDGLSHPPSLAGARLALTRISLGGIYDHLAGGIARYSVDERWLVPHFEKMLYDNAHYLRLLCLADRAAPSSLFRARISQTVRWLQTGLRLADGGFASSLDADSEGEEGRYYVWRKDEIDAALGPRAAAFSAIYGVTEPGNFEGRNILNRLSADAADETEFDTDRQTLLEIRDRRIRPGLDDKILADWNGYAIRALAECSFACNEPEWLALAIAAYRFVVRTMQTGSRLRHSFRDARVSSFGFATDHASMMNAAISLHQASGDPAFLADARRWADVLAEEYTDGEGGLLLTPVGADLITRPRCDIDEANPAPSSQLLEALARLSAITGENSIHERAHRLAGNIAAANADAHHGIAGFHNACDTLLNGRHVTIGGGDARNGFLDVLRRHPDPALTYTMAETDSGVLSMGWKIASQPADTAIVCSRQRCSEPLASPDELARFIARRH